MRDKTVRQCFHSSILESVHQNADTIVLDELGLRNGEVRADIAVLNGKMTGYEIKTDKDNLNRLHHQIPAYNEVFDQVYIVTGARYLNKVIEMVPEWWGIFLIEHIGEERFSFDRLRKADHNDHKSFLGVAQLLWKDEIIDILSNNFGCTLRSNTTKQQLYRILEHYCNATDMTKIALKYLKSREGWRTNRKVPL